MTFPEQAELASSVDRTRVHWVKATKSISASACVELASSGDWILLRDSKNPEVQLRYSAAEIDAFLDGAKRGEFDHLLPSG
jgi:hypothetical protein